MMIWKETSETEEISASLNRLKGLIRFSCYPGERKGELISKVYSALDKKVHYHFYEGSKTDQLLLIAPGHVEKARQLLINEGVALGIVLNKQSTLLHNSASSEV